MHWFSCSIIVVFCLTFGASARAQVLTPGEIIQQTEQLQRQQQQELRRLERERDLQELERDLEILEPPLPEGGTDAETPSVCFDIHSIELRDADNLRLDERAALTEPYLGRCLTVADIDRLRAEIDRYYIEQGWILSRAYLLPGQNLKDGVLIFQILEGRLDGIELNENQGRDRRQLMTGFPGMREEVANIREIEQGLEQMNRLPSNGATMDIVPVPERPGYGRLVIDNTPQDRFRSRISVDNYGAQSTGRNQNRLVLDVDNLLWLNDQWFVSGSRYAGDRDDRDSESLTVNMSLPYGYWTIDLSHSYSSYLNTVSDATGRFELSGDSQTTRLTADRVVHRDRHSKTGLGLALTRRENESFLEDVLLQTSSRTLSVFTVEADHVQRVSSGVWSYALRYARGLDAFGALQDGPIREDDVPRAQFEKIGLDVSALHDLDLAGLEVSYRGLLSGQISRDPLFGSEQLALGDQGTVRGFLDLPVAGDSGMFLRNDFIWSANGKSSLTRGLNLSVGLDLGYVEAVSGSIGNSGQDDAWIAGAALGLSQSIALPWWDQALSWSAVYARPLREPDFIEADDYVVYARLDWKWW